MLFSPARPQVVSDKLVDLFRYSKLEVFSFLFPVPHQTWAGRPAGEILCLTPLVFN